MENITTPNTVEKELTSEEKALIGVNLHTQMKDLDKMKNIIEEQRTQFNDDLSFVDERIANMTVDEVKALSDAEITAIFTNEDGVCIIDDIGDTVKDTAEFRRDYLIWIKESGEALANISASTAEINNAIKEYEEDIKNIIGDTGRDMTAYVKNMLQSKYDKAETEENKKLYADMIKSVDSALNLDIVIDFYSNGYRARTAVVNLVSPKTKEPTLRKYHEVMNRTGCKTDFRRFGGIEKFLPEEYKEKRANSFMYAMINFIAFHHKHEDLKVFGLFLAQFSINLKNLIYNGFCTEEDKETFVKSVCTIIDMVA